jgi:hypothetical protein
MEHGDDGMKPIKEIESQYRWATKSKRYKDRYFSSMSELYKQTPSNKPNSFTIERSILTNVNVYPKK